ncbi:peptide deformylase [Phaeovulum vinaykumarii]|uniref:Peptide deformylase n=1 Tax=Phaeovulum vinaykumarii TaxID=407234 RepID=A0A1N7MMS0_9RHOB|nr:peptide deformylase [Phaeovulum vinaykumarii]SIS87435.1 peptide deformylase [Phaeovulum vinaykumarii]SOC13148.1 peptide deformylase [Phaeovulum vinaykumarii]
MSVRSILIHPDPRLKKVCDPVASFDADLRQLADDMLETMYDAPGIGLAAPQLGVMQRVFVMDCKKEKEGLPEPMVLINPEITWTSEETGIYEEGCLSIPGTFADVTRPQMVRMRWFDVDGKEHEQEFGDLWATCAQHEFDHLEGKLFIDYLGPIKRKMITRKMEKLKRDRARGLA